jgi:integral membrane protein (TIGR00529 family)
MTDLAKLLGILVLVVFLLARRWNLGLVLLLAAVLLGVLFARTLPDLGRDILTAVTATLTLRLVVIVVLIMVLGGILQETAGLERMVDALQGLVPDARAVLALWPAFIGLLPMVGGAMFSAPLVNQVGERLRISAERRTFVNYWFRHAWEYVFPIYPSLLLGAALLGISERRAAAALWPLFAASVAGGVLFGLLGMRREDGRRPWGGWPSLRLLLRSGWPVALVLLLTLALHVDLVLSLALTVVPFALVERISPRTLGRIARHRIPWHTVVVILGAMVFREVLETTDAVTAVSTALAQLYVPHWVILFSVPFAAGLLTGLGVGAFSIGFPIILPLLSRNPPATGELVWTWAGAFLGVMVSPMHLCLALTRDYFRADWGRLYRILVPATLLVAAVAGGMLAAL